MSLLPSLATPFLTAKHQAQIGFHRYLLPSDCQAVPLLAPGIALLETFLWGKQHCLVIDDHFATAISLLF